MITKNIAYIIEMAFHHVFEKLRKISKAEIARRANLHESYLVNITNGARKPPNYNTCLKIANAMGLNNQELSEFLLAAMEERFGEEDKGFFELVGLIKVQEIISDKFGILFDDKRVLDLLYDPSVIEVLQELHSLEPEKKSQAMNMLKTFLKGLR